MSSGFSIPWCCTGRGKKNKNVRLVLPTTKDQPYKNLDEDDAPAAAPPSRAQCGLFLAIILLIGILGAVSLVSFAFLAPETYDVFMEYVQDYEDKTLTWFTTYLSNERCDDGLFIPGPLPSRLNVTIFLLLLLWSFMGVAVAADIFMVPRLPPRRSRAQQSWDSPSPLPCWDLVVVVENETRSRLQVAIETITSHDTTKVVNINGVQKTFTVTVSSPSPSP